MSEFLERYGYRDDWQLAETPVIRPEHCSEYFPQLLDEKRRFER